MPCGYTKRYTFDGDSGALASLARSAQPLGLPGAALKTTFHPGLPGMATSPDVGTAWSRPQSDITVKPAGSFDHVPPGGGGGNTVTVTAPVPLCASLVAVIVPDPTTMPATSPLPLTVATAGLLVVQVTVRPVRSVPLASLSVATSCSVCPTATLAEAGLTVTEATGAVEPAVVPLAPLERAPNNAFTFRVPRNATSWNW